ncbi:MAG: HEAT repeat domain-containing protein [Pirellulales bacterium]
MKQGPDGAIYIADWYNPIIQHGEVDFRDPRRDHVHGRIWRVTFRDRAKTQAPQLADLDTEGLLAALESPDRYTRQRAKRLLKQRGAETVAPALAAWLAGLDANDAEYEHHRLEGLWTYQALDVPEPALLGQVLESPDHRARAAAVRVLYHWQDRLGDDGSDATTLASRHVVDQHPRVRLEAVRALGRIGTAAAVVAAMQALDMPTDRFLDHALWLTARETSDAWLPQLVDGQITFVRPEHTIYALEAVDSPAVVPVAARLAGNDQAGNDQVGNDQVGNDQVGNDQVGNDQVGNDQVGSDVRRRALELLARHGGPAEFDLVLAEVFDGGAPAQERGQLLESLVKASQTRGVVPDRSAGRVGQLVSGDEPRLARAAIEAAGRWQVEEAWMPILEIAISDDAPVETRIAAARSLAAASRRSRRRAGGDGRRRPNGRHSTVGRRSAGDARRDQGGGAGGRVVGRSRVRVSGGRVDRNVRSAQEWSRGARRGSR